MKHQKDTKQQVAFGHRLREARFKLHCSQADVAYVVGVRSLSISRWECGKSIPGGVALIALARALGVSAEWLITGQAPRKRTALAVAKHMTYPSTLEAHDKRAAEADTAGEYD